MWLPTPIYERTPQLWLLMAVLFIVLSLYIGFAYELTYFYVLLGGFCGGRGVHVLQMRRNYRHAQPEKSDIGGDTPVEPVGGQG